MTADRSKRPTDESNEPYDPLDPEADHFRPPSIPTLVWCLHCGEEYDSWKMQYRIRTNAEGEKHGFWCCGIEGCDGVGFGFDIHPVDEDYIDPDGRDMGQWFEFPPPDPETDCDRPPDEPTPVRCEQCGKAYLSSDMVWDVFGYDDEGNPAEACWACPNPDCHGMGFGMDVRPTDPDYTDPHGRRIWRPGEKPKPPSAEDEDDIPF